MGYVLISPPPYPRAVLLTVSPQRDEEYIIIKKYIDHALLDELFEHTRKLKEHDLITYPYVKESPTPNDPLVKKGDRVFVTREKSQTGSESQTEGKSPADRRRSWMFT
jgi:hypothetical protein